jgi:hypothetical protein
MSRYQQLQRRLLGVAFVLGPALITAAAGAFILGVKVTPDGVGSVTEGLIGFYGMILFIPVYLELARLLGQRSPYFGIVCAVTGLLGASAGVVAYFDRIQRGILVAAGLDAALYQTVRATVIPEMPATGLNALLFPLTSILLGIGFLRTHSITRWPAIALILAGACFVGAQATETRFGLTVLYPLAGLLWLGALAPIGWRYLTGEAPPETDAAYAAGA